MSIKNNFRSVLILLALLSSFAVAGEGTYVTVEYQLAFPGKTMKDFVDTPGYSGFNLEFAQLVTPYIALGGSFGWNNFYDEWERQAYDVEEVGSGDHAGGYVASRWRQIDAMPVMFKTAFIYDNAQVVVPFVSAGIGAYFMRTREIVGPISTDVSSTHFGLRPEAGMYFMFGAVGIKASGAWNAVFKNSSQDADGMSHWNLGLGVTFAPARY